MDLPHIITFVVSSDVDTEEIVNEIQSLNPSFSLKESLPLNRVRHQYNISQHRQRWSDNFTQNSDLSQIMDRIKLIELHKLTFRHFPQTTYVFFLQDYLSRMYVADVSIHISTTILTPIINYTSMGKKLESSIYLTSEEIDSIRKTVNEQTENLDKLSIGISDLTLYVIDSNVNYKTWSDHITTIKHISGNQYLLPLSVIGSQDITILRKNILSEVQAYVQEGYFRYINPDEDSVIKNKILVELWNNQIIKTYGNGIIIARQRSMELTPCRPDLLITNVFRSTYNRDIPLIKIGGPWQILLNKGKNGSHAQLLYQVVMIAKDMDYTNCFLDNIIVHLDYSISVPLVSFAEYTSFRAKLIGRCDDVLNSTFVQQVKDNTDAFVLRSKLYDLTQKVYMSFSIGSSIFVVGPSLGKSYVDITDIDRSNVQERLIQHHELEGGLKHDLITMEPYSDMVLNQLISIIRPEKDSEHCTSVENLRKFGKRTSMVTKRPLSNHTLRIVDQPYITVSGYTKCGYLPGLFDTLPCKYDIDIDLSKVEPTFVDDEMLVSDIVVVKNARVKDDEYRKKLIEWWNKGKFLSVYDLYIIKSQGYQEEYNFDVDQEFIEDNVD